MVEVNGEDIDAQRQWQQQLAALGAEPDMPDWEPAAYENWQLAERRLLNPGSAGGPAFLVSLRPATGPMPSWQAGDIAEVLPGANDPARIAAYLSACGLGRDVEVEGKSLADHLSRALIPDHPVESAGELVAALRPLPHREYSIASVPGDGSLDLLVRQVERTDGTLGLGSGWLTHFASPGGAVSLRLRANEGFHAPAGGRRLILIGNGTGLAGLRGHLRQSRAEGRGGHWLLFGERSRAHDALLPGEVDGWLADGTLTASTAHGRAMRTAGAMCSTCWPKPRRTCGTGWKTAPRSSSAAAFRAWPRRLTTPCAVRWATNGWKRWPKPGSIAAISIEAVIS
ncbi:hypothetical protein [Novosphingobium sp. ST904]|uniref:hypothetical protein n=1 Tax=Novosphingobium sp. ST904 TaxID=1684385 RepID=UPI0026AAD890